MAGVSALVLKTPTSVCMKPVAPSAKCWVSGPLPATLAVTEAEWLTA